MSTHNAQPLELRRDGAMLRHVLAGRVVTEGDEIELALDDGSFIRGRYAWAHVAEMEPVLRLTLAGPQAIDDRPTLLLWLPRTARLRWPA